MTRVAECRAFYDEIIRPYEREARVTPSDAILLALLLLGDLTDEELGWAVAEPRRQPVFDLRGRRHAVNPSADGALDALARYLHLPSIPRLELPQQAWD